MAQLTIRCEVDGHEVARYEFDCISVQFDAPPGKGQRAALEFVPNGEMLHRMVISPVGHAESHAMAHAATCNSLWEPPS